MITVTRPVDVPLWHIVFTSDRTGRTSSSASVVPPSPGRAQAFSRLRDGSTGHLGIDCCVFVHLSKNGTPVLGRSYLLFGQENETGPARCLFFIDLCLVIQMKRSRQELSITMI